MPEGATGPPPHRRELGDASGSSDLGDSDGGSGEPQATFIAVEILAKYTSEGMGRSGVEQC